MRRVLGLASELAPVLDAARAARSARADELKRQSAERGEYAAAASHVLGEVLGSEVLGGEVRVEAIGPAFHLGLDADPSWRCSSSWRPGRGSRRGVAGLVES
ncbi:MAG: hypothetical protein ACYCTE_11980 [Acidimicrobiales bacterium]